MPKRIVRQSIVLYRENKQVRPELNKVFDFTVEELEQLKGSSAVGKLITPNGSEETPEEEAKREAEEAQKQADDKKAADAKKGTATTTKTDATKTTGGKAGDANDL